MIIKIESVALCDASGADCLGNHFVILNNAKPIRTEKAICMKCGDRHDCQIFRSKDVRQRDRAIIQRRARKRVRPNARKELTLTEILAQVNIKKGSDFNAALKSKKVPPTKRLRKNRRK